MKKFLLGLFVVAVVAFGVNFFFYHKATPQDQVGGIFRGNSVTNPNYALNGFYANQYYGLNSVSASSSSTTAANINLALGSSSNGQITIGTSTPGTRVVNASTTAVGLNSMLYLQQTGTTTIPGTTCNATATVTPMYTLVASTTNTSLNGFTLTAGGVPVTNPLCYNYWVFSKSQ